jgi:allantoin racemase
MKILVINPNTSRPMTNQIRIALEAIKRADTDLTVTCPEKGPETIESAYDEAYAIPPTLELVKKANQDGYDAVILACFSDPGLDAAKEISTIPVIGIEEATLHIAAMLGAKFSIMTPRKQRIPSKVEHVHLRGLSHFLASVRSLDLTVAETEADPTKTKQRLISVAKLAVEKDGAEVIIMGCAGMAGYAQEIEQTLNVKVLDPSAVALKTAEAIADLGLSHSKVGLFATPPEKLFK